MKRAAYRPHAARDSELLIAGPLLEGPASRRAARPAALPQGLRGGQKERRIMNPACLRCIAWWSALLFSIAFWIGVFAWVLM